MTTTATTLRRLKAAARTLGATVTVHRDCENLEHEVLVDAPDGCVWSGSGVHQLVCAGADGTPLVALYDDALDRMSFGTEPCDVLDCDVCHPTGGAQ
jgi:hypothetical protein